MAFALFAPRNVRLPIRSVAVLAALMGWTSSALAASKDFFPIQDVRPGLRGIGKTVFQGDRIEDFQVEILGVIQNFGPRQPIVLARLSGGPLAETGILQGMSGSPVYIGGKLLGAVALGFPFSKEPIAGIQPIQSMLDGAAFDGAGYRPTAPPISRQSLSDVFSFLSQSISPNGQLTSAIQDRSAPGDISQILTPISMNGFTSRTLNQLDAPLHRYGLTTKEGVTFLSQSSLVKSSNSIPVSRLQATSLKPGSMISVGLITGELSMTADGTVTYVDGNKIYAFGHRFLNVGSAEMPFAYSDVIACVPSTNTSFKLSAPREWIGTIISDHATAIAGELGRSAHVIPLEIAINSTATGNHSYRLQVVNDRLLTPFLTQAALFSTLDATERTIGAGTLKLKGEIHFEGNLPSLIVHDLFVSDSGLAQQASADAVVTLAFVLGGGFRDLHVKDMNFQLEAVERKKQLRLSQAWTSAHSVHPGETVDITAVLQAENGVGVSRTIPFQVPIGAPLGALNLTLSDANVQNFPEFAGIAQTQFESAAEMITAINSYRDSEALYVRVWRPQPAFSVAGPMPGGELTDPPPSIALVLADTSSSVSSGASNALRGSGVAQMRIPFDGFVITGAKTIQIEVKD